LAEYGVRCSFSTVLRSVARVKNLVILLLLFILLTAVVAGVTAALTGPSWSSLWVSLLLGMLFGWLLALFRWKAWWSTLLLIALGVIFTLLFAGGLSEKFLAVISEIFRLVGQIIGSLNFKGADLSPLSAAISQVVSATGVVLGRVFTWINDVATGQPAFDPVAAGIVWSALVWLVAAWSGWVIEAKKNALMAVLPALIFNLSVLSYGRINSVSIYLILGLTLILIAVVQFDKHEHEWNRNRVAYPTRKGREMGNISLGLAFLLVVLAAIISSLSLQQIIHLGSSLRGSSAQGESGLAKSLGIATPATSAPNAFTNVSTPGLPRALLVGAGPELSKEQVMTVRVQDLTSLILAGNLPPLYWKSFTYDIYTGHGWSTSTTAQQHYQPDQPIQPGNLPDHTLIQQQVSELPGYGGTVYAAGEPVELNITSTAAWRTNSDLFGIQSDSSSYQVQSLIPMADEATLRAIGQAYPAWVAQRYLSVPAEVPTRVRELAIQLTATEATPYDRAHAIEQYLRNTFPYTLEVPLPPANQDLVDYFLFDLRKGYCDYYASAMVILARVAGLPARLAIGYATGTYILNSNRFSVTQADAHSWVEVYFPTIGWVPFEPTAGSPPINRSGQVTSGITPTPTSTVPPPTMTGQSNLGKMAGFIILGIIVMAGMLWWIFDTLYLIQLVPRLAAREVYRRLNRYGRLLKVRVDGGETPYELGRLLSRRMVEITSTGLAATGVIASKEVYTLIDEVVHVSYRPAEIDSSARRGIVRKWRRLRWRLRLVWLAQSWDSINHSIQ
jgi:transglutaminase-like putative cysteine protease